ncbi:MAG: putative porin, partial [Planctomycetota bacterium]
MRRFVVGLAVGFLLLGAVSRAAETSMDQQVRELTERIEALEASKEGRLFDGGDSWVDKFSFKGDFRYRHEMIKLEPDTGRDEVRHRHRIRARLEVKATVNDDVYFKLRLATGSDDPISRNQTLDDEFEPKSFVLDQAYVGYKPQALKDYGVEVKAGKLGVPFHKPAKSQLIFDGDLTVEGISAHTKFTIDPVEVFFNVGGFWVEESGGSADNGLFGVQLGAKIPIGDTGVKTTVGVSGYIYANVEEEGPFVAASGNSLLAGEYEYEYNLIEF